MGGYIEEVISATLFYPKSSTYINRKDIDNMCGDLSTETILDQSTSCNAIKSFANTIIRNCGRDPQCIQTTTASAIGNVVVNPAVPTFSICSDNVIQGFVNGCSITSSTLACEAFVALEQATQLSLSSSAISMTITNTPNCFSVQPTLATNFFAAVLGGSITNSDESTIISTQIDGFPGVIQNTYTITGNSCAYTIGGTSSEYSCLNSAGFSLQSVTVLSELQTLSFCALGLPIALVDGCSITEEIVSCDTYVAIAQAQLLTYSQGVTIEMAITNRACFSVKQSNIIDFMVSVMGGAISNVDESTIIATEQVNTYTITGDQCTYTSVGNPNPLDC